MARRATAAQSWPDISEHTMRPSQDQSAGTGLLDKKKLLLKVQRANRKSERKRAQVTSALNAQQAELRAREQQLTAALLADDPTEYAGMGMPASREEIKAQRETVRADLQLLAEQQHALTPSAASIHATLDQAKTQALYSTMRQSQQLQRTALHANTAKQASLGRSEVKHTHAFHIPRDHEDYFSRAKWRMPPEVDRRPKIPWHKEDFRYAKGQAVFSTAPSHRHSFGPAPQSSLKLGGPGAGERSQTLLERQREGAEKRRPPDWAHEHQQPWRAAAPVSRNIFTQFARSRAESEFEKQAGARFMEPERVRYQPVNHGKLNWDSTFSDTTLRYAPDDIWARNHRAMEEERLMQKYGFERDPRTGRFVLADQSKTKAPGVNVGTPFGGSRLQGGSHAIDPMIAAAMSHRGANMDDMELHPTQAATKVALKYQEQGTLRSTRRLSTAQLRRKQVASSILTAARGQLEPARALAASAPAPSAEPAALPASAPSTAPSSARMLSNRSGASLVQHTLLATELRPGSVSGVTGAIREKRSAKAVRQAQEQAQALTGASQDDASALKALLQSKPGALGSGIRVPDMRYM